jgi:CRP-like cAMP-binding protein
MVQMDVYKKILIDNMKKYTELSEDDILGLIDNIYFQSRKKGEILLMQGNKPGHSYYLLKGCIRQYASNELGIEATVDFYIEEDPINMFSFTDDGVSLYSLSCIEDCLLVECNDTEGEDDAMAFLAVDRMKRQMFEKQYTDMQKHVTSFKLTSPEERLSQLKKQRPDLLNRVPQVYLASYLGMTPEAFSRIKKRIHAESSEE